MSGEKIILCCLNVECEKSEQCERTKDFDRSVLNDKIVINHVACTFKGYKYSISRDTERYYSEA